LLARRAIIAPAGRALAGCYIFVRAMIIPASTKTTMAICV
jgi:hypothetical protein